jgi:hypothetical protein
MFDPVIAVCAVFAVIVGVMRGFANINSVKEGYSSGYPESNNLFTFLFVDKYK